MPNTTHAQSDFPDVGFPTVAIVGAGLAGLAAAVELADRGIRVAVFEANSMAGGKLSAWRDQQGDPVEHGIHGWWPSYVNFFEMLARVGVPAEVLQVPQETAAIRADGTGFEMRLLKRALPSPLFLLQHIQARKLASLSELIRCWSAMRAILAFDCERDYDALDRISFADFLRAHRVPHRLVRDLFEPYVRSFAFDKAEGISAGAAISSLHFYLLRDERCILPRWLTGDPAEMVIGPLVRHIESRGGIVNLATRVSRLVIEHGAAVGMETNASQSGAAPPRDTAAHAIVDPRSVSLRQLRSSKEFTHTSTRTFAPLASGLVPLRLADEPPPPVRARVSLQSIPATGFIRVEAEEPIFVGRDGSGFRAVSGICTHAGCQVAWKDSSAQFHCPCHGAVYSSTGLVVTGPATRHLPTFPTRIVDSELHVLPSPSLPALTAPDCIVLACDVHGAQALWKASTTGFPFDADLARLGTTAVLVVRLWFSGEKLFGERTSGVLIDFPVLDTFFVLSNMQPHFVRSPSTVIEVQGYVVEDIISESDDALLSRVLADLSRAFPSLQGKSPVKYHVIRHEAVFSHHNPQRDMDRPTSTSPVDNVFFAGDWTGRQAQVWNMERAIVSGKLAAAAVLRQLGGPAPISIPLPRPGLLMRIVHKLCRVFGGPARNASTRRPVVLTKPGSTSVLHFVAAKRPRDSHVIPVHGRMKLDASAVRVRMTKRSLMLEGTVSVDFMSVTTGIAKRDEALRTILFANADRRTCQVEIIPVAIPAHSTVMPGTAFEHLLRITVGGISQAVPTRSIVWRDDETAIGWRTVAPIRLRPSDFGFDVGPLSGSVGVDILDEVRLVARVALEEFR